MASKLFFQYCQKIVLLSTDQKSVLLAKRKGEADYDSTYSFIGGKMETTDKSIVAGIKREKDEEISKGAKIKILPHETYNVLFRKKDGSSMILPHIVAIFQSGNVELSDEYSDYKWVKVTELTDFEPKVENIPEIVDWALSKLPSINEAQYVEI